MGQPALQRQDEPAALPDPAGCRHSPRRPAPTGPGELRVIAGRYGRPPGAGADPTRRWRSGTCS
ncbi:hypothetical protein ACPA9J_19110 [Pseudomonas aeruginosa]